MSILKVVHSSVLCMSAVFFGASPLAANMLYQCRGNFSAAPSFANENALLSRQLGITVVPASELSFLMPSSELDQGSTRYVFVVIDPVTGAGILTLAGGAALADGPLPIGDIIAAGILIGGIIILWSQTPEEHIADCEQVINELQEAIALGEQAIAEAIAENDWWTVDQINGQIEEANKAIDDLWNRIIEVLDMYGPLGGSGGAGPLGL
jgi:hypothetical protein